MSLDADAIAARRQLKRQLWFWRFAALMVILLLIVLAAAQWGVGRDRIAVLPLHGVILGDDALTDRIASLRDDPGVKAVILDIDSPGGSTAATEGLYEALRELAETKPLVARMNAMAASGGYLAAIAADHVVARHTSVTGSLGVLFQTVDISALMDTVGVDVEEITSGPLKADPSGFEPMSAEARRSIQALVDDSYEWLIALVMERRRMTRPAAERVADGRIMSGHQALEAGLVDAIGGEAAALDWLEAEHGIDRNLPLETVAPDALGFPFAQAGAAVMAAALEKILQSEGVTLDGLVSVWQPHGSR